MLKPVFILFLLFSFQLGFTQSEEVTKKQISVMLSQSGLYLMNLECEKSLKLAKEAINYAYVIEDDELVAKAYNIIGLNFEEFSDFQKAIAYYKKGLEYANKTTNDSIKDWLHGNLGNVYTYREIDFDKGISHYKKGLEYSHKIKSEYDIMYANLNIASAYFAVGDFKIGLSYLKDAESPVLKSNELEAKITLNSLFGSYYTYKNDFVKAEKFYKTALKLCNEDKPDILEGTVLEVYDDVSNMYLRKKDFEKAYIYLYKHKKLKDKFYNEERTKNVKTAGLHIEQDEFKREIDRIEKERDIQIKNLKQSKIIVVLFVVVFLILLLLLYILNKNNKFKIKINEELMLSNQDLKIAIERAEEASVLKSQFVSTISHELRTPLYGVVGITNMILDEHKELNDSPYINSLKFSAKYLLSLVNDILQINKIEENRIVLETHTFNISDEISTILSSLQFIANNNNNKLNCDIDPNIPEFLIGDKLRLSQIFMNLVSNALKFTKNGKVLISANLVMVEGNINFIKFQVSDNGIGIAKENQNKIFEKFVQIGRKEEDYQGTGLGLAIVKRLIELLGSEIFLESQEAIGTTFTFTIGFESDIDKTTSIINNFEVDLSSSQIFKVLVVEDNKINQMVTKKILESNNYQCDLVDDGFLALKLLEKESYDVILMDLNMPVISGFVTAVKVRELGIKIPIIALTAFSKEEVIEEVIASGMNDIIVKPFESVKLFQIINSQILKNKNAS